MNVHVTAADISTGRRRSFYNCALARAITRASRGLPVAVGKTTVFVGGVSFPLPPSACRFVQRFDGKRPVAPIRFDLCLEVAA